MRDVAVVGAAALSPAGAGWRGLSCLAAWPETASTSTSTSTSTGERAVLAVPEGALRGVPPKLRKMASRAAELAAFVTRMAIAEAGFRDPSLVGYWLGVGASGGSVVELEAMLAESFDGREFSPSQLGEAGLQAVNPLFAFQLMNNFTLCHAAILEGVGGPNGAFFSRGAGTVWALNEALFALASGECDHALAGGADSALHPVTQDELSREGFGVGVPAEGAALLALSASGVTAPLAWVRECRVVAEVDLAQTARLAISTEKPDVVVLAPWGAPARKALGVDGLDVSLALGNSLAAAPALAWCTALDALVSRGFGRALVLTAGVDGDLGVVVLERP